MQKAVLILFFSLIAQFSFCQKEDFVVVKYTPKEVNYSYRLGNKTINLKSYQYGDRKDIVMINLHSDETTSVEAAKQVLQKTGGILLLIENNNERIVSFMLHEKRISFDPNRIFTKNGIIISLRKFNHYSYSAARKVEGFAKFILSKIPEENITLIALHNNDDGDYSIDSYATGELSKDVTDVHIESSQDKDNFFFTTDAELHKVFIATGYNSALQDNKNADDDGSLSVYYGKRKKSYVNNEVELNYATKQAEMLWTVLASIKK